MLSSRRLQRAESFFEEASPVFYGGNIFHFDDPRRMEFAPGNIALSRCRHISDIMFYFRSFKDAAGAMEKLLILDGLRKVLW